MNFNKFLYPQVFHKTLSWCCLFVFVIGRTGDYVGLPILLHEPRDACKLVSPGGVRHPAWRHYLHMPSDGR